MKGVYDTKPAQTTRTEVKVGNTKPSLFLQNAVANHPDAAATQLVLRTPHGFDVARVGVRPAAQWLANLAA